MALIIPGGYGQVIHSLSLVNDPEPMAVTYGVKFDAQAPADAQATVQGLHSVFNLSIFDIPHSSYTLQQTEMRYSVAELADPQVAVVVLPIQGRGSAQPLPQNCAVLFHKRSNSTGRRNRGRFFLPGMSEGAVDPAGRLNAGEVLAFSNLGAELLDGVKQTASIAEMVILHSDGVSTAPLPTVVTSIICDPVIATQRRRLRR
jgi:hypothetical protein